MTDNLLGSAQKFYKAYPIVRDATVELFSSELSSSLELEEGTRALLADELLARVCNRMAVLSVSQAVVVYNLGKFMSCFPCPFVIFLSVTDFFCVCV